jgi:hypothetical protein
MNLIATVNSNSIPISIYFIKTDIFMDLNEIESRKTWN